MFTITNEQGDVFADKFVIIEEAIQAAKDALADIDGGPIDIETTDTNESE